MMIRQSTLVIAIQFLAAVQISNCQDTDQCSGGFTQLGELCYGYINLAKSWFDAQAACKDIGGHLAEPADMMTDMFITGLMHKHDGTRPIWLGAEDLLKEGSWFWANSGKAVDKGYTDWMKGQPNNINNQDCMELHPSGHWEDNVCNKTNAFICQRPASEGVIVG